jgi:Domain of unknown function (DUF4189)
MKKCCFGVLALALVLFAVVPSRAADGADWRNPDYQRYRRAQDRIIDGGGSGGMGYPVYHYASLSYSRTTRKGGWSRGYLSWEAAEAAARKACGAPDAQTVFSIRGGWCALAIGDGGASWGHGTTAAQAKARALRAGAKFTTNCRIVACVCGD